MEIKIEFSKCRKIATEEILMCMFDVTRDDPFFVEGEFISASDFHKNYVLIENIRSDE